MTQRDVPGYEELARILDLAYDQSARGKGKDRHANNKPFTKQPIMEIGRMVGLPYHTGQIQKKVQEATTMASRGNIAGAKAELLGAIVYASAAYLLLDEAGMADTTNVEYGGEALTMSIADMAEEVRKVWQR